jgi:hypothetical protein
MHFPFELSQAPLLEQGPSPGQSIVVGVVVMMVVVALLVGTALAVVGEVVMFELCLFKLTCWFDWPCKPDCWFGWPCCEPDC